MSRRLMPLVLAAVLLAAAAAPAADTTPFLDYRTESWFLPQSPSVLGGPAAGLFNPAAWGLNDKSAFDAWEVMREGDDPGPNQYGFALGRKLGLAWQTQSVDRDGRTLRVFDYALGLAGGGRRGGFGLSYRWATGDTDDLVRQSALSIGMIGRPSRWASFGASALRSLESDNGQYVLDVGLRPLGRHWLTVFADWTVNDGQKFIDDGVWGAGCELRPWGGLHLGGRIRDAGDASDRDYDYSLFAGVTFSGDLLAGLPTFDENGEHFGFLPVFDQDGDLLRTAMLQRSSPPSPGFDLPAVQLGGKSKRYYPVQLENRVLTYQKYRWFDDRNVAWLDLLKVLNHVRDDGDIDGVAINLAGFRGRPSLVWEMRVKLEQLQAAGKEVIVHVDRPYPVVYYLATVADRVTIDPWGNLPLPGFALSRSYLKGTLAKLGIGFQEFRYFKYKSAVETFSRDSMSPADREQRQRIVDVLYEETRAGAVRDRGVSEISYDQVVDELGVLSPDEAIEAGLVDAIARWDDLGEWLGAERDGKLISAKLPGLKREYYDEEWGEPLRIPVVFAVGSCAMDSGIRGRATSAYLRGLIGDPGVPAVVLRADSPGGDVLPSDLIADAVRQLREAGKPVIVSQGDVAASGGYWISMDGTEVLTTPLTVTGSIGVIGGWAWDDGLAAKAGVTSDAVQRGRHADLPTLIRFPFLGGLPRRPMDEAELARVEKSICENYDRFVDAVAAGRGLDPAAVGKIAQGRVWMGGDAIERGLCDRFGTLDEAIALARTEAGIPDWQEVAVVEYPPRKRFRMPSLLPSLPSLLAGGETGPAPGLDPARAAAEVAALRAWLDQTGLTLDEWEYLRSLQAVPGRAQALLEPDLLPVNWTAEFLRD